MSPTLLTCENVGPTLCPRGDLNPHPLIRGLAPQASASAYSATRTSAVTLASQRRVRVIGGGVAGAVTSPREVAVLRRNRPGTAPR